MTPLNGAAVRGAQWACAIRRGGVLVLDAERPRDETSQ
jgi:hypothetical protein